MIEPSALDRLHADITAARRPNTTMGAESTMAVRWPSSGRAPGVFSTPERARLALHELDQRLSAASKVYPGIGPALNRGVIEELETSIHWLAEDADTQRARAEDAAERADYRLEGAMALYDQLCTAQSTATSVETFSRQADGLNAYARELEATLHRVRPKTAQRLIEACLKRSLSDAEEPF